MRKAVITLLALGVLAASPALAADAVRISQVYGGNGTTGSFNQDYVELFNSGATDVDLSGWAVEYSSSASTAVWGGTGSTWQTFFVFPSGATIKPCSYVLVGGASTVGGTAITPAPDYAVASAGDMNFSGTNGRVGLFNAFYAGAGCGAEGAVLIDKVAYGTATCPEGAASAPAPSTTTAIFRGNGGMDDTDNNSVDFTTGTPAPRSSTSERDPQCLLTPAVPTTWGQLKARYR
jgi:hypothetical protein